MTATRPVIKRALGASSAKRAHRERRNYEVSRFRCAGLLLLLASLPASAIAAEVVAVEPISSGSHPRR